jgi:hypothetical protein
MSDTEQQEFWLTFGQRFAREHHPAFTSQKIDYQPHPDGWVTILAPDETAARELAYSVFGSAWSSIYLIRQGDEEERSTVYPLGELGRLETTIATSTGC